MSFLSLVSFLSDAMHELNGHPFPELPDLSAAIEMAESKALAAIRTIQHILANQISEIGFVSSGLGFRVSARLFDDTPVQLYVGKDEWKAEAVWGLTSEMREELLKHIEIALEGFPLTPQSEILNQSNVIREWVENEVSRQEELASKCKEAYGY